jgi:hypothetical protein
MLDGKTADVVVKGALVLLGLIIVMVTFLVWQNQQVPQEFTIMITTLVGALAGFLTGTRVVPPDISAQIKTEPLTPTEVKSLAEKEARQTHD